MPGSMSDGLLAEASTLKSKPETLPSVLLKLEGCTLASRTHVSSKERVTPVLQSRDKIQLACQAPRNPLHCLAITKLHPSQHLSATRLGEQLITATFEPCNKHVQH